MSGFPHLVWYVLLQVFSILFQGYILPCQLLVLEFNLFHWNQAHLVLVHILLLLYELFILVIVHFGPLNPHNQFLLKLLQHRFAFSVI